ncbi:hypothetical protein CN495_08815 [Bacillus thuringiensis]|uniref:Phage protein n=1 Tax=Bacillus thuringiensis TaxID=1428 RepID=A0ABD6SD43_BACTU|nr:hypothetical protein [Bacillus thuringiensis]KLA04821.1 hypothetical protein B4086_5779 [Bacillus cereus]PER55842.1 hypothetical protein CN495_08815 [Bacillus thuringiensis]
MTNAVQTEQTVQMIQERITTITREFKWGTEYAKVGYVRRESMQFNEGVPRKAIQAEDLILSIRVKHAVVEEAFNNGDMEVEEFHRYLRGSVQPVQQAITLLREIKESYLDAVEAAEATKGIISLLAKHGIVKQKNQPANTTTATNANTPT